MQFRSTVNIPKSSTGITHQQSVLCMGSCFASNITQKLTENGFDACNPFGALYNPISIAQGIQYAIKGMPIQQEDLFLQDEKWHHIDFHSDFSHSDKQTALQQINQAIARAHQAWQNSHVLIITLGTQIFSIVITIKGLLPIWLAINFNLSANSFISSAN